MNVLGRITCRLSGEHVRDPARMGCSRCGATDLDIVFGRLWRRPTWAEYDAAVEKAWNAGEEFGRLATEHAARIRTERAYSLGKQRIGRHMVRFVSRKLMEREALRVPEYIGPVPGVLDSLWRPPRDAP